MVSAQRWKNFLLTGAGVCTFCWIESHTTRMVTRLNSFLSFRFFVFCNMLLKATIYEGGGVVRLENNEGKYFFFLPSEEASSE